MEELKTRDLLVRRDHHKRGVILLPDGMCVVQYDLFFYRTEINRRLI